MKMFIFFIYCMGYVCNDRWIRVYMCVVFLYFKRLYFITIRITLCNEALFGMTEKDKKNLLQRGFFYFRSWEKGRLSHKNNMHHRRKANRFYCRDVLWWQLSNWNWKGSCNAILAFLYQCNFVKLDWHILTSLKW